METDFQLKRDGLGNEVGMQLENSILDQRLKEAELRVQDLQHVVHESEKELSRVTHRAKEDLENTYKYAIESFARSLLPFKDNLETSLRIETSDVEAFLQGLELSAKQLDSAFESCGSTEIDPSPGDPFDPARHDLAGPPAQSLINGTVHEVLSKGCMLGSRVLKKALVSVQPAEQSEVYR
ncbi:MAG: nucleotide exchange factor GrpE [Burkholderiaceae bacterium]